MKLYSIDYTTLSEEDSKLWEEIKKRETVSHDDKTTTIRKSLYRDYPKSARHFMSLFPNNFIDAVDLIKSADELKKTLGKFEGILNAPTTTERDILNFIRDNEAHFIIGSIVKNNYNFGHHALFAFPEFKLPPNYQADYLLVGKNSGGYHFVFVELENPNGNITLQDGTYGSTIRKGIKQIEDWDIWIEENFSHLRLVFERIQNKDETLPKEFRDFDKTRVHYVVVAGKRKDYLERTYRLKRNNFERGKLLVIHYDNLIDFANEAIGSHSF